MKKTKVNTTKVANDIKDTLNINTVKRTRVGNIKIADIMLDDDNVIKHLKEWVTNDKKNDGIKKGFEKYLAEKCNTEKGKQFIADTCNTLAYQYNGKTIQHKTNMKIVKKYQDNMNNATNGSNKAYGGKVTLTVKRLKGEKLYKVVEKVGVDVMAQLVKRIKGINKDEMTAHQINECIKHLNTLLEVDAVVNE